MEAVITVFIMNKNHIRNAVKKMRRIRDHALFGVQNPSMYVKCDIA